MFMTDCAVCSDSAQKQKEAHVNVRNGKMMVMRSLLNKGN